MDEEKYSIYKKNDIVNQQGYTEIVLRNKYGEITGLCKIDTEDVEKILTKKWHLSSVGYCLCSNRKEVILLHRLVTNAQSGVVIDHINRDKLDNRKHNLRTCTQKENMQNTKSLGVSYDKVNKKWRARIMVDGKTIYATRRNNFEDSVKDREILKSLYFESLPMAKELITQSA